MKSQEFEFQSKDELLKALEQTREETLNFFDLEPIHFTKSYLPGKWNIKQLLHHITDAETVLYDRLRRVIAKPNQVIWAFDQEAWANKLDYQSFPLALNKQIYSSVRAAVIYLAQTYYEELGDHAFVHSDTGKRTLKEEFDKIAWHNQGHLNQINAALAK